MGAGGVSGAVNGVAKLLLQLRAKGLAVPELEYRFHPERKWRLDLAWPDRLVAVEVDGEGHWDKVAGRWVPGRHHRTVGYRNDLEKLNAAAEGYWRVFRFVPAMVESGEAVRVLGRVLG